MLNPNFELAKLFGKYLFIIITVETRNSIVPVPAESGACASGKTCS